jgi:hypothetical protein
MVVGLGFINSDITVVKLGVPNEDEEEDMVVSGQLINGLDLSTQGFLSVVPRRGGRWLQFQQGRVKDNANATPQILAHCVALHFATLILQSILPGLVTVLVVIRYGASSSQR